jgi:two-component system, NarL family, response regulator DesR
MKIAIFDDHEFVIDSIVTFLKQKPEVEIVGTAKNKHDILKLLSTQEVHILIADILTEEEIGLSLFEEIQKKGFASKVIVFTNITSEFIKDYLFDYGVVAFLNKKESIENLWETIKVAYQNTKYQSQVSTNLPPTLTLKEKEIVGFLAKGLAAKEIAILTNTSVNTINNQKNHLIEKFNCTNSTELAIKLIHMGYLKM